ncbi:MAG: pullulanase-type alpha-1,6-glucosidase [Chloroflexi bacterium]|nr:pullulanase-type alpha-1,6-glucosidase [Chloroflexota bacterium]
MFSPPGRALAQDTPDPETVVVPGTIQSKLGCSGDWQPDCADTALTYNADKAVWEGTFALPAGSYEYKIALNGSWTENYGLGGQQDGPNIPLVLGQDTQVTFTYNHKTHQITDSVNASGAPVQAPQPDLVVIPGTLQSELGCSGDWQPDCPATALAYDEEDGVWQGAFTVQPDNDQDKQGSRYKAALNGSWAVNYGRNAQSGGADIPLILTEPTEVKFYYDHKTHWVADSVNEVIAVAMGTFQSELGCAGDNDPGCLRSWLQDPGGTGTLALTTRDLPPGDYEVKVALNESTDETYGADGAPDGTAIPFTVSEGNEVYLGYDPITHALTVSTQGAPRGDLTKFHAHWVTRDTIAWNTPRPEEQGITYALYYAPDGGLKLEPDGVTGGQFIPLKYSLGGLPFTVVQKRPFINGFAPIKIDPADFDKLPGILRSQTAVVVLDKDGKVLDATSIQIPGVLDDLYSYDGPLGVTFDGDVPTLRVWAPTARSVTLHLFDDSKAAASATLSMTVDAGAGVWNITGEPGWTGKFYLYEVEVYVPSTGKVEKNLVTDPYSFSLSMNSTRSQIVDLADSALMPAGWADTAKPPLAAPEDIVLYELHIRDFSISDASVPQDLRGTYRAFTVSESNGMKHLKELAEAGLTHIHLLPAFDIASVNEDKSAWQTVDEQTLAALPPDSEEQQLLVGPTRENDGFNWGYDPFHYTTPEGSYSTNPDGPTRILEFREMVQALNRIGLRVVMDVVYNHTNASGQNDNSVLDKIVPGYYHRLNADGRVETSTCCQNTATENAMMEKLMIDSLVTWATAYKVDGFRFDLMGHHMVSNMVNVRAALDGLTLADDGVDGKAVYVYGEGWNFGEVADNKRGVNATQLNIGGTGIGVFNDRLRDAARGGGPFGDPREQGFITGLFTAPSDFAGQGGEADQKAKLLKYTDWIRVALAGNLKEYALVDASGQPVTGEAVDYNGSPAGYTLDPQENIVYASAHDNETLFDAIQWKAPAEASVADRTRMNSLGVSLVMLSQGVPFFHAGDDLLRSKSLDGNSYNSSDWFNKIDWTGQRDNWGVGLPAFGNARWDLMAALLGNPALKPAPENILSAAAHFREMLQIRKSSALFRLQTAEQIQRALTFLNTGPEQTPGLIVMRLTDADGLDDNYKDIVVLFNAQPEAVTFADESLKGLALTLHPVQQSSADVSVRDSKFDSASGAFSVPGRTTVVFVVKEEKVEPTVTAAPAITATPASESPAAQPPTLWIALGGVLVAGLAGLFFWRRSAKK